MFLQPQVQKMNLIILFLTVCCLQTVFSHSDTIVTEIMDLTWPFSNSSIYWVNNRPFQFIRKTAQLDEAGDWYASNEFCASEHGGTHFDAPYHFNKDGWKVGEVPPSRLIVRGIKIDLSQEVSSLKDEARLLPAHLKQWEKNYGRIPSNSVLLVRFGWSEYYSNREKYLGMDGQNNMYFPGISADAAEWIANSKKFVGVGVDTASVDAGQDTKFLAHKTLSAHQIYTLENVNIPDILPDMGFILYVMPMMIEEGTGAPLRLFAVPLTSISPASLAVHSCKVPFYHKLIVLSSYVVLLVLYRKP